MTNELIQLVDKVLRKWKQAEALPSMRDTQACDITCDIDAPLCNGTIAVELVAADIVRAHAFGVSLT